MFIDQIYTDPSEIILCSSRSTKSAFSFSKPQDAIIFDVESLLSLVLPLSSWNISKGFCLSGNVFEDDLSMTRVFQKPEYINPHLINKN